MTSGQWASRSCEQDHQAQPEDKAQKPKKKVGRRPPRGVLGHLGPPLDQQLEKPHSRWPTDTKPWSRSNSGHDP